MEHERINDLWEDMDRLNALYEEMMWAHDDELEFVADYRKIESLLRKTQMTEETIKKVCYTKEEVDALIKGAVDEARRIDEESMKKHNRDATVISMILGFTALALFVDGLLRLLGIIPPFMGIDIDLLDKIVEKVEGNVIDKIRQVPIQKLLGR
tara:strand:+ start:464 stop:925 length:462 start_codon:yes stop_codon:yes gene_type:complete